MTGEYGVPADDGVAARAVAGVKDNLRRLEAGRPEAPLPPELWAVIGLISLAGAMLLYQTVPVLPDVVEYVFSADSFKNLGLFFAVFFVEIALLGIILLALAYALYCGDASARLTATVLCAALGVSYLLQEQDRTNLENWVLYLSLAIAGVLVLAPATREWFATAKRAVPEPTTVAAARSISSVMAVALGMIGLGILPAASFEGIYLLIGGGLCAVSVVLFRKLGDVRAGDADARTLVSALMVGYVVLLLMTRSEASADTLIVPVALAAAVVGLLWLPAASQLHFGGEPVNLALPGGLSALLRAVPAGGPGSAPQSSPGAAFRPAASTPSRRAPTVFHDVVGVVAGARTARSSRLQLDFDQESWFPSPPAGERVRGAYLVSMALVESSTDADDKVFQGTSTLLVTDQRLAGVCPKGTSQHGRLDAASGPVVVWSVPLEEVSDPVEGTSSSGSYLSLARVGHQRPWLLLAKPRAVDGDAFVPVDISRLAAVLRARRPAPPVARERTAGFQAPPPRRPAGGERPTGAVRPPGSGQVAITAKQRSRTALRGDTLLSGPDVLSLVKTASSGVKGGGASLLTTGLRNIGAQVNLESESRTTLHLSLSSGKRLVDLCSFTAAVGSDGAGRTTVRIGGLDAYRTQQQKFLYLIPVGPKQILGMAPYKRFLQLAAELITEADPSARLTVGSQLDP